MTDKPKRHYDGNSETCCNCKAFYADGGRKNPCNTCVHRIKEEVILNLTTQEILDELVKRDGVTKSTILYGQAFNIKRCIADDVSIQWMGVDEGYGEATIIVVRGKE